MDITTAATLAESLMAHHGLTATGWTFKMDRATVRLGLCQFGPKVISLGAVYVESADEAAVRDIILHEIAHALVGAYVLTPTGRVVHNRQGHATKIGHGWQWKIQAREIGCSGQRSGHNPAAAAKQEAKVDAAKARTEHVAHITTGPLQVGELVQTAAGSYRGILTSVARVNGTILNERDGKPWKVPLAYLHRVGGEAR
ncbi:MAG: hypothetical protein H7201_09775 [Candidatus Saccharibacteria bacterium]|nr:hypothetical protein [Microbacteriaceae bacterium]